MDPTRPFSFYLWLFFVLGRGAVVFVRKLANDGRESKLELLRDCDLRKSIDGLVDLRSRALLYSPTLEKFGKSREGERGRSSMRVLIRCGRDSK